MTRRELEIEAHNQRLYALEAHQQAEDMGYALQMLMNNQLTLFYTCTIPNKAKYEFFFGIAKDAPIDDIPGVLKTGHKREDRRIILWKITFEPGDVISSACHDSVFKSSPKRFNGQDPEFEKILLEAIRQLHEIGNS